MKFLADENFDNKIVRGILRRNPDIDIVMLMILKWHQLKFSTPIAFKNLCPPPNPKPNSKQP